MLTCRQATRLLSDAQDCPLPLNQRAALKFHVLICVGCRRFAKQMHTLRDISRIYVRGNDSTQSGGKSLPK